MHVWPNDVTIYKKKKKTKHNDTYNYRLQNLCGDGRQNPLIVILTDAGEDTWQLAAHWPEEDTQCNVDVLQICGRGKNELPYVKKIQFNKRQVHCLWVIMD